jgi:hypothetical protein
MAVNRASPQADLCADSPESGRLVRSLMKLGLARPDAASFVSGRKPGSSSLPDELPFAEDSLVLFHFGASPSDTAWLDTLPALDPDQLLASVSDGVAVHKGEQAQWTLVSRMSMCVRGVEQLAGELELLLAAMGPHERSR